MTILRKIRRPSERRRDAGRRGRSALLLRLAPALILGFAIHASRWQLVTAGVYLAGDSVRCDRALLQQERDGCGAAALAYVIERLGGRATEAELTGETRLRGGGTSFGRLRDAAESRGYHVRGGRFRGRESPYPPLAIVHLKEKHFVVVEAVDSLHVRIFDPAFGRVVVARRHFAWITTGFWIRIELEKESGT